MWEGLDLEWQELRRGPRGPRSWLSSMLFHQDEMIIMIVALKKAFFSIIKMFFVE